MLTAYLRHKKFWVFSHSIEYNTRGTAMKLLLEAIFLILPLLVSGQLLEDDDFEVSQE